MSKNYIYRCEKKCSIGKHCFIIKTIEPLRKPIDVLVKCQNTKKDILVTIGEFRPP